MRVQNKGAHKTHLHIVTTGSVTICFARSLEPIHTVRRFKNKFPLFILVLAIFIYLLSISLVTKQLLLLKISQ
jgi:hypothetical protein